MIDLGQVNVHADAEHELRRCNQSVEEFTERFRNEDYGDIDAQTRQFNEAALREGGKVLGCYEMCSGVALWIVGIATASKRS